MEGGTIVLISLVLTLGQPGLSLVNLSRRRPTSSSDFRDGCGPSSLVVDDNDSTSLYRWNRQIPQCLFTIEHQLTAFWQVDLGQTVVLDHVVVIFKTGDDFLEFLSQTEQKRRNGYSIIVTTTSTYLPITPEITCYSDTSRRLSSANKEYRSCNNTGKFVTIYNQRITYLGSNYSPDAVLTLCEVQVMGCPVYKHGVNCLEDCPENCINRTCFPGNGACMQGCQPGYTGTTCDTHKTDAVSLGQLIGIISGVTVLLICVVAVVTVVCVQKRRKRQNPANDSIDLQNQRPTETVSARNDVGAVASPLDKYEYNTIPGDSPYDELDNYERLQVADVGNNPYISPDQVVEIDPSPNVGEDYDDIALQAVGSNVNPYSNVDSKG